MLAQTCYDRDELQRYLLGRTDDQLCTAIEAHLESCGRCEDTLSELDGGEDTLVRTLQVRPGEAGHRPAWLDQLAQSAGAAPSSPPAHEADDSASREPLEELADYELDRVLGRGGMSVVFSARHKHLGREAALKVLLPAAEQHTVSRERFTREMRAVGALDHPAIVRATDAGQWNDTLYLVMEQIDGVDLNRVSRAEGPLRVADACAIVAEVAGGLAYAHQQGVVHRDVKPSNLMLERSGAVKILDFGLARVQSTSCDVSLQTTMGQLLGTLDYMAPEQANGADVDARADIYALGATLFKLLTGAPPHGRSADTPIIEYLHRLATQDAPRVDEQRDQVPPELIELIASMLHRDPEQRPRSAREIQQRLLPLAEGAELAALAAGTLGKSGEAADPEAVSVRASLAHFWSSPPAKPEAPPKPPPTQSGHRPPIGPVGWLALATGLISLVGVIVMSIVLTLKMPEGEIRIESDIDNVKVEVVDEKDRARALTVENGGTITTVRAGRYRIRLDSPSDGVEVSPREVVVKRNQAVIARIRKIGKQQPAENAGAGRDPQQQLAARLELKEATAKLDAAKKANRPDEDEINTLEKRIAQLRALSRPIPTEPVYEGRTLADWVAQMRFEQQEEARKRAAENVRKLVHTTAPAQRVELTLEAGSRLLEWRISRTDLRFYSDLHQGVSHARDLSSSAAALIKTDPDLVDRLLGRYLQSQDRPRRLYARILCVDLREHFRRGEWSGALATLEAQIQQEEGSDRTLSQLALAACKPDSSGALRHLARIEVEHASDLTILSMFHLARERSFKIERDMQLQWAAACVNNTKTHQYVDALWNEPLVAPFRNIESPDAAVQLEYNAVVVPLLVSVKRLLASADEDFDNERVQHDTAQKIKKLLHFVNRAPLTGSAREQAVELLGLRLQQLFRVRNKNDRPPQEIDTPAEVGFGILMLTGSTPAALRRRQDNPSGYMADQLHSVRRILFPPGGSANFRGAQGMGRGTAESQMVANWYPYEILALQHEASVKTRRPGSMSHLLNIYRGWRVRPELTVDYALCGEYADESGLSAVTFVKKLTTDTAVSRQLRTHSAYLDSVVQRMEKSDDKDLVDYALSLWSSIHPAETRQERLLNWLRTGDAIRKRLSMRRLTEINQPLVLNELAQDFAAAVDDLAKNDRVQPIDLHFLYPFAEKAPRAAEHARTYLDRWLDKPEPDTFRPPNALTIRGIQPAVQILQRSLPAALPLEAKLIETLRSATIELDRVDRERLENLLARLIKRRND